MVSGVGDPADLRDAGGVSRAARVLRRLFDLAMVYGVYTLRTRASTGTVTGNFE